MKKFLAIVVLSLLWCNVGVGKILNLENRVLIEVPNKYEYFENDSASDFIDSAAEIVGENPRFFIVGTKSSIEFTKLYMESPEEIFLPIQDKMGSKNFKSEKQMLNFMGKEMNKFFKKNKYNGVIWVLFGDDKIDELDQELIDIVEEISNMNNLEIKTEEKKYKKKIINELITPEMKNMIKIKKFKIAKDEFSNPTMYLNLSYNVPPLKGSSEFYAFIKDDMPVVVMNECLSTCKTGLKYLKTMIKPTFAFSEIGEKNLPLQIWLKNLINLMSYINLEL